MEGRVGLYRGATGAWSMELWRKYGPIQHTNCWEDVVMGFRAALENSYKFVDEPLVKYRVNIGLSSQGAQSLKGKIAVRKNKANLKRDLARQRYDDLALSPKKSDTAVMAKISKQALMHSIRSAYYQQPLNIWKYFKEYPSLTMIRGTSEGKFLLRAIARVALNAAKA
jgi:hypothetical protein